MSLNNPLDNSDVPIKETDKSAVGGYFQSIEQAKQYKLYLENLELLTKLSYATATLPVTVGKDKDGHEVKKFLPVNQMIPKESEFDRTRKVVIIKLNTMSDDELRQWMARFGSDNIFHLSELISSYIIDKKKRDEAFNKFEVWQDKSFTTEVKATKETLLEDA